MDIKVLLLNPEKLRVPRELLMLKHPFWGLFLMFVKNDIIYVVIVVFYSADFKFTYVVT